MRVVITGNSGQLGRQLRTAFAGNEFLLLDLPADDITQPAICERVADFKPDLVLHAAAFTDVDGCEQDPERAFRANAVGTQHMALGAQAAGAALVYISTNEVFGDGGRDPCREWDQPNPIGVYARSKAAGERIVRDLLSRFYIVRIAWLFGPGGNNFVTKILSAARQNGALRVAADEFGNPTYAPDLAAAVHALVESRHYGIYHLTNSGFCSRCDFARAILQQAGHGDVPVTPILSADWPRPSRPPLHSVLANTAGAALGLTLRPWEQALAEYVTQLRSEDR